MEKWEKLSDPSLWRKIAVGMWGRPSEPTILGSVTARADRMLDYLADLEAASGEKVTPTAFFVKILAEFFRKYPDLNVIVIRNQVMRRKDIDIFCQVSIPGNEGADADLSGFKIPNCDERSIVEIARYMRERAESVRREEDDEMSQSRGMMRHIPSFLMPLVVRLTEYLTYLVPFDFESLGLGPDPFGSAMLSSIGVFDVDNAFAPLVPSSRSPLVVLPGAIHEEAVAEDGEVVARDVITVCTTADHRCYDGYQGGLFVDTMRSMIEQPREHFTAPEEFAERRVAAEPA